MKRLALLLILVVTTFSAAHAQPISTTGATPAAFIPPGYRVLRDGRATGDLNGDGRPDVALALSPVAEDTTQDEATLAPRLLLVLWRSANGYRLAATSRRVLLCKSCGGVFGDPFAGLRIERGGLLVSYDVGGNNGRSTTARFRQQQGKFYLIGETDAHGTHRPSCDKLPYPPGYSYHDTNLLTGAFQSIQVSEECKLLENRRGRQPVRPLRTLAGYQPAP